MASSPIIRWPVLPQANSDEGAAKMLTELLGRDGYTVEIRRPPVLVQPTG